MSELTRLTAAELAKKLNDREVSAVEATEAHLDRIRAVDGDVQAFLAAVSYTHLTLPTNREV